MDNIRNQKELFEHLEMTEGWQKPEVEDVLLEKIERHLDGSEPTQQFIASVANVGILTPVLLAYTGSQYQVIAGRRRIKTCRFLGWETIPARVYDTTMNQSAIITLTENAHRSHNPVAELKAIHTLQDAGYSVSEIASLTGLSTPAIKKRMKLAVLDEKVIDSLEEGSISITTAEKLAGQPVTIREQVMDRLDSGERVTGKGLREMISVKREMAVNELPSFLLAGESLETKNDLDILLENLHTSTIEDIRHQVFGKVSDTIINKINKHLD